MLSLTLNDSVLIVVVVPETVKFPPSVKFPVAVIFANCTLLVVLTGCPIEITPVVEL